MASYNQRDDCLLPGADPAATPPPTAAADELQGPYDALTGLPGAILFIHRLHQSMRLAERDGHTVAVMSIGLDCSGPDSGGGGQDRLLSVAAQCLLECMGHYDTLGRLEGLEFVAAVAESPPDDDVAARCQQLLAALAPALAAFGQAAACVRIGVALFPHDGTDSTTLLRHARLARAHAGEQGLPCQFFSAETKRLALDCASIDAALRLAIGNGELLLLYQPLADLHSGAVAGLEALLRWQHPQRGLLAAADFIPRAEASGQDASLAEWVLQRACRDLCALRAAGHGGLRLTLNVSNSQFRNPAFPARVATVLQQHGLTPEALALEITESALTQAGADCDTALAAYQAHGLGLTLDDFGTGHSSLANLKRFPFDALKIDSTFVRDVATNTSDAAMCQTIIAMAHHLGMRAVAEGVETESQCAFLRRSLCDMIQGYFFSEPLPLDGVTALLREQRCLPAHLLHDQKRQRRLLLVDDEPNIVASLKRLLRTDQYQIYTANSGQQGLDVLAQHAVDVIVSDQRMPGMLGADFLRMAKQLYPDTIRIMLSGYTELQSVTDAVNEGAIYKFLTKPWDDELLRKHIADAFRVKEIADDNARLYLELQSANQELAAANRRMGQLLLEKQRQISRDEISLNITREVLQRLPLPIIGIDDAGMIAFANGIAEATFARSGTLLGSVASMALPELFEAPTGTDGGPAPRLRSVLEINRRRYAVVNHPMGEHSASQGSLITLVRIEEAV
jgi:EAL domain-containing protein (putative c-di-GMP-specific phosphodiesterase class I)/DNA-binding response OmpR family regulator/GGDEF domain-containing protein